MHLASSPSPARWTQCFRADASAPESPAPYSPWQRLGIPLLLYAAYLAVFLLQRQWAVIPYSMSHALPLLALREDLWGSLLYLHSQPPGYNFLLWLVHWPHWHWGWSPVLGATLVNTLFGIAGALFWYRAALAILRSVPLSTTLLALLLLHPGWAESHRFFFYDHHMIALIGALCWAIAEWTLNPSLRRLLLIGLALVFIAYVRTLCHPLLGVLLALWLGLHLARRTHNWRRGAATALTLSALVLGLTAPWLIKNAVLFDSPSFSSWTTWNLHLDDRERVLHFRQTGQFDHALVLSHYADREAVLDRLLSHPATAPIFKTEPPGHVTPQNFNMNHYAIPALAAAQMPETLAQIRANPATYLRRSARNLLIYFNLPYKQNPYHIDAAFSGTPYVMAHEAIYRGGFLGMVFEFPLLGLPYRPSLFQLLFLPLSLAFGAWQARRPSTIPGAHFGALLLLYLWLIAMLTFVDGLEGSRMRWPFEGIYLILLLAALRALWRRHRARRPPPFPLLEPTTPARNPLSPQSPPARTHTP